MSLPGKKNNSQVLKFSVSQTGSSKHSLSCRVRDQFPGTEMEKYALFTYESLKKTKCREFVPSRDEIEALISRQEMTSTVYCHGGGSCKITINSHTTAGEVRRGDRTAVEHNQFLITGQFQPVAAVKFRITGGVSTS